MYKKIIKLILARVLALLCILLVWPIMLVVAISIKLDSRGRVLFIQERIGKHGKAFRIFKFRSMKENAFNEGTGAFTYENDPRITKVGRFIRKTSLDELPQLFNILKGDMCFIGPRPLLPSIPYVYYEYPEEYRLRFNVLPGMFCLVDTLYRAEASYDIQFELDVKYVKNISLIEDIKIFIKTFKMVLLQKGVYVNSVDNGVSQKEFYDI